MAFSNVLLLEGIPHAWGLSIKQEQKAVWEFACAGLNQRSDIHPHGATKPQGYSRYLWLLGVYYSQAHGNPMVLLRSHV
ncbi:hypothetical protein RvY_02239 [Ramazzottius varieornatus]|uniref:Uncharacterized protein n=1 Tax=Ramazzottius varieornatus TaxID=947166 RepID=A0A1D1UMT5_RAMVA|nr:hypothetical protein RvY_02239 [Ramazzottius varieornatus]